MRRIDCGTSGTLAGTGGADTALWSELGLDEEWLRVLSAFEVGASPRAVQVRALRDARLLTDRTNVVVAAPTNSGKSLVGTLALLDAVRSGRRALLLEPLRALAREKADELEAASPALSSILRRPIGISISTGDYRLDDETMGSAPPARGEIVVATPERAEALLRRPDHAAWFGSLGTVVVDEAHLLASPRRGPTLEFLLTSLLCLPTPPRLVLLSATLGDTTRLQEWLRPCTVVSVTERHPPLHKWLLELGGEENANDAVVSYAREALADPAAALLVFVYQTRSTRVLADALGVALGPLAGPAGPLPYHAQMSSAQRELVRARFRSGASRCVVATTALGLGVNLPATHVLVRDAVFPGVGQLEIGDLLQMLGRAGRGSQMGTGAVIVRPGAGLDVGAEAAKLRAEAVPEVVSQFDAAGRRHGEADRLRQSVAAHVAAYLARLGESGATAGEVRTFFASSLGGVSLSGQVESAVSWLEERLLVYRDDACLHLTRLGERATRAALPLHVASGYGQLVRDLMSLDDGAPLAGWAELDHLIVLGLLSDRPPSLRPFSEGLADGVDSWMEAATPDRQSLLYRCWLRGQTGASKADEVLGSLSLHAREDGSRGGRSLSSPEWARREGYLAVFRAVILHELGSGTPQAELERRWQLTNLEGIEERWRDEMLWLMSGVEKLLDTRCFYYYLLTVEQADQTRLKSIERSLRRMRFQTYALREHLKYCSPLGPLLRSLRRTKLSTRDGTSVGVATVKRLEDAGVRSISDLASLDVGALTSLGIRAPQAHLLTTYMRRRMQ